MFPRGFVKCWVLVTQDPTVLLYSWVLGCLLLHQTLKDYADVPDQFQLAINSKSFILEDRLIASDLSVEDGVVPVWSNDFGAEEVYSFVREHGLAALFSIGREN